MSDELGMPPKTLAALIVADALLWADFGELGDWLRQRAAALLERRRRASEVHACAHEGVHGPHEADEAQHFADAGKLRVAAERVDERTDDGGDERIGDGSHTPMIIGGPLMTEPDQPLPCFYCAGDRIQRRAELVVHDRRGCLPCCEVHAAWRRTTSTMPGHGSSNLYRCPQA